MVELVMITLRNSTPENGPALSAVSPRASLPGVGLPSASLPTICAIQFADFESLVHASLPTAPIVLKV